MKYIQLSKKHQNNAIINYCNIMGINLSEWVTMKEKIINWFIVSGVNTLDKKGRFIHAGDKNVV